VGEQTPTKVGDSEMIRGIHGKNGKREITIYRGERIKVQTLDDLKLPTMKFIPYLYVP